MLPPRFANYGSGPDLKQDEGNKRWDNFDSVVISDGIGKDNFHLWNLKDTPDNWAVECFDGGLINHVLCTMTDEAAHRVLINIHRTLKPGAILTVIDMDLLKVFSSYREGRSEDIPIKEGTIDDKLCFAISGYGTRKSLYTPERMRDVLTDAGFRVIWKVEHSEYDTRPKESLVFEAMK